MSTSNALLSVQDLELKLLDNMKISLNARLKCDREYAAGLQAIALNSTSKLQDMSSGLRSTSSSVMSAWTVISQEMETLGQLIRKRSDGLRKEVLEPLELLISERKALRKAYFDEHSKQLAEIEKVNNLITKTHDEYSRAHDNYNLAKTRFEEMSLNCHGDGTSNYSSAVASRKAKNHSTAKGRLLKRAKNLHLLHNHYCVLLVEGQTLSRDVHEKILPAFDGHHIDQLSVTSEKWKDLLDVLGDVIDFTGEKFQATQWRVKNFLSTIKDKDDYREVRQRVACPWPTSVSPSMGSTSRMTKGSVAFDSKLLDGKQLDRNLKENQLIVDTFTYDALKNMEYELQTKLVQIQRELREKEKVIKTKEAEVIALSGLCADGHGGASCPGSSSTVKRNQNAIFSVQTRQKAIAILRKDVLELDARHDRIYKLWETISEALQGVGDKRAIPLGEALVGAGDGGGSVHGHDSRARSETPATSGSYAATTFGNYLAGKIKSAKNSMTSLAMSTVKNISKENQSSRKGEYEGHQDGTSTTPVMSVALEHEPWYHGALPREDVQRLLRNGGDYLVRETLKNGEKRLVVSTMVDLTVKHFLITETDDGFYKLEGATFRSLSDLLEYHVKHSLPLTIKSNCVIKKAITKDSWELSSENIVLKEKIGKGNFGDVYRGILKRPGNFGNSRTLPEAEVAVKTCKINLPDEQKRKFLQEARILMQYEHENIVRFVGICVQMEPIMLVMELVAGGSLLAFLRRHRSSPDGLETSDLLRMSMDAARGMRYLESKNCIHRDLAARNCLVTSDVIAIIKISDFGMSREAEGVGQEYTVSNGLKQIPIKWTAPEALNYGRYTSLCDVWSFGILLWELFTLGSVPYAGMSNAKARQVIEEEDYRLPSPPNTPVLVYQLMKTCWSLEPEKRYHFEKIYKILEQVYKTQLLLDKERMAST